MSGGTLDWVEYTVHTCQGVGFVCAVCVRACVCVCVCVRMCVCLPCFPSPETITAGSIMSNYPPPPLPSPLLTPSLPFTLSPITIKQPPTLISNPPLIFPYLSHCCYVNCPSTGWARNAIRTAAAANHVTTQVTLRNEV